MGNQIIKQPNGLYAIWSTVNDDFTVIDCTREDLIEEFVNRSREQICLNVSRVLHDLSEGRKPYYQFTQTFDECVQRIRELHGDGAESLKLLSAEDSNVDAL